MFFAFYFHQFSLSWHLSVNRKLHRTTNQGGNGGFRTPGILGILGILFVLPGFSPYSRDSHRTPGIPVLIRNPDLFIYLDMYFFRRCIWYIQIPTASSIYNTICTFIAQKGNFVLVESINKPFHKSNIKQLIRTSSSVSSWLSHGRTTKTNRIASTGTEFLCFPVIDIYFINEQISELISVNWLIYSSDLETKIDRLLV